MAIHDWTRVPAGVFHNFHHDWISTLCVALKSEVLGCDHYALIEPWAGMTFEKGETARSIFDELTVAVTMMDRLKCVPNLGLSEEDFYAKKANRISIRHSSDHRMVAAIEIVVPGNKSTLSSVQTFVQRAAAIVRGAIDLLVIDLFPPGAHDPDGIQNAICAELSRAACATSPNRAGTLGTFSGGNLENPRIETLVAEGALVDMPLKLSPDYRVLIPMDKTYHSAWSYTPEIWRSKLQA